MSVLSKGLKFVVAIKQTYVLGLMMKPWRRLLGSFSGLLFSSLVLFPSAVNAADSLPYYDSREFTPHWLQANSPELEDFHRIPSFSFTDQDGEKITDRSFENKIYVAGFFFSTCPGICPTIRSKLSRVQEEFLDDPNVRILQHSIQPETDSLEVLKKYADEYGIESGKWHLVTGDKDAIYGLAKNDYFASDDLGNIQNTDDFLHTENLLLIDQNRHIRGIYNGLSNSSVAYLMTDIEALKAEMDAPLLCH